MDRKADQEMIRAACHDGTWAWAGLVARLILGLMLVVSGASKTAVPAEEFAVVIEAYDIVPVDAARTVAALLPWVELLVGFSLLFGYFTPLASLAAGAMFACFLGALISTKARGIELPNCGCFGDAVHFTPAQAFLVDACIASLSYLAWKSAPAPFSLDNWTKGGYTGHHAKQ